MAHAHLGTEVRLSQPYRPARGGTEGLLGPGGFEVDDFVSVPGILAFGGIPGRRYASPGLLPDWMSCVVSPFGGPEALFSQPTSSRAARHAAGTRVALIFIARESPCSEGGGGHFGTGVPAVPQRSELASAGSLDRP